MVEPFSIAFENGQQASAVNIEHPLDLAKALDLLDLRRPRPVLVLVGGAGRLGPADLDRLRPLFVEALAPIVEELGACVIDGGTDAGVMRLMGQARHIKAATFPLVGVAAADTVTLPGEEAGAGTATLEPCHTHVLLVPGSNWGDEVPWISDVASVLAGKLPSVTVLVSGGMIAYADAAESILASRPVIAICGSGGTADVLAEALCSEHDDERTRDYVRSGLLHAIAPMSEPALLRMAVREHLEGPW
jgi:hypothetical protein